MLPRKPYEGSTRKLVLAFDVGTTFSGVSYCILDPGEVPVIHGVTKYPGREQVASDSKIPSIIYYDLQGDVCAVGAEVPPEGKECVKLEWWKLHLRPKHLASSHIREGDIPPLPRGKSAVQVLADFMRYLFRCAQTYIQESGPIPWRSVQNSIEFVLTHPNGWEGLQQQEIRRAAELAGLVLSNEQSHVHLLTEGEASLHFCVANVIASDAFSVPTVMSDFPNEEAAEDQSGGQGVVVVDAGGGTIDLSAYSMKSPTSFEEIAPAECYLQGSALVTCRARTYLENKLSGSKYSGPEMIAHITSIFDKTTKLVFHKRNEPSYVMFSTIHGRDLKYNVLSMKLRLTGHDVAGLFEPSVQAIIDGFEQQRCVALTPVNSVFLVGGFAANNWLFARLQEYFQPLGISLCRPDCHGKKAVADGAVSFYIDHFVSSRVACATYGTKVYTRYNPWDLEHQARKHTQFIDPAGDLRIPNQFSSILIRGTQVSQLHEFRKSFHFYTKSRAACGNCRVDIMCYEGDLREPKWIDDEQSSFSTRCTIYPDLSELSQTLCPKKSGLDQSRYYEIDFEVIILFDQPELKAQVSWKHKGIEMRSPASIVYDE